MLLANSLPVTLGILLSVPVSLFLVLFLCMIFQAKKLKEVHCRIYDGASGKPPIRIAFISDLHFPVFPVDGGEVIRRIAESDPDCVMIGGDLCQSEAGERLARKFLRMLSEQVNVPILIVLGNHDISGACHYREEEKKPYAKRLEECGDKIRVLINEHFVLKCRGTDREITVGGVDDWRWGDREKMKAVLQRWNRDVSECGGEFLLLAHNPDIFTVLPEGCAEATLCGHTHGGQVYLPFNLEFRLLRKDVLPKKGYKYGLFRDEKKGALYITSGLGCSMLPIRFMTSAEIAYIDL